jgi:hypothetical protein
VYRGRFLAREETEIERAKPVHYYVIVESDGDDTTHITARLDDQGLDGILYRYVSL